MPQSRSPAAGSAAPDKKRYTTAGTSTREVPMPGMSAAMAAMLPQSAALGTPKTAKPTAVSMPWIRAITMLPLMTEFTADSSLCKTVSS